MERACSALLVGRARASWHLCQNLSFADALCACAMLQRFTFSETLICMALFEISAWTTWSRIEITTQSLSPKTLMS